MIDFRQANVRDVAWWRRCNVLIAEMEREDDRVITQALLHLHCAYVSNGSLESASFKAQSESAKQQLLLLFDQTRPWTAAANSPDAALQRLTDKYKEVLGDPNDPAFLAKIADGIRRHEQLQRESVFKETEEQRVHRLIRERDLRRAAR